MAALTDDATWGVDAASPEATAALAQRLAQALPWGSVVALSGELGAGKTHFVQGLAAGLGVFDLREVLSPTYTLINEYPAPKGTLVHVDLYRLAGADAAIAVGLEDFFRHDTIVAIEWPERAPELLPATAVWITLARLGPQARRCTVEGLARPEGV